MPAKFNNYLVQLRDQIAKTFDLEELRALTFDLQLEWDELEGSRKTTRIQDLITQLAQNGKLETLVELLDKYRPRAIWPTVPTPEQQKQDIRTAFPKKPLYQQPSFFFGIMVLLAIIGIYITILYGGQTKDNISRLPVEIASEIAAAIPADIPIPALTTVPIPSPTPLPFQPAFSDETLIVIATFYQAKGLLQNAEVHNEIRRAIQASIDRLNLRNEVRVEVEPSILRTENRDQADALGNQYNATLIIWGEETSTRIEVNFLNLKEPDFVAAEATISETENTQVASVANPDAYSNFVTEDLPGQLNFLSFFALGQAAYNQENYEEAIDMIETAVAAILDSSLTNTPEFETDNAYFRLGWLYQITEQPQAALSAYDQAIDLNPRLAEAFNNRGLIYNDLNEYERAISDFGQAIALSPEYTLAFFNRGLAYYNLGEYEQAISDYEQAIALNPEYIKAINNRGLAYYSLGEYEQAISNYDQAITLDPEYALAFYNRGFVYRDLGEYEQAFTNFQTSITLKPFSTYSPALNLVCWFGSLLGHMEDVASTCDQAISLATDENLKAICRDSRGLNRALRGDFEESISDFQAYADFFMDVPEYETYVEKRISWINSLSTNENPFDVETLQELLDE